jgi:hypothetical protein
MKKIAVFALTFALMLAVSFAAQGTATASITVNGAVTNTATLSLNGQLDYIKVTCPSGATGTVSLVTTDGITLFSKASCTGTNNYLVRLAAQTTAGASATFVGGTNDTANTVYVKLGLADSVTATVIQAIATTNTYGIKLVYEK